MGSFGLMMLGKADIVLLERARTGVTDVMVPALELVGKPVSQVADAVEQGKSLIELHEDNQRLRLANETLLQWERLARHLEAENAALRELLAFEPSAAKHQVSARVVAERGAFVKSILVNAGGRKQVRKGAVVMTGRGLVGRVAEVGRNSARVLLLTDINSRIPVFVGPNRSRAVMVGTNANRPILRYLSEHARIRPGDRVTTSGNGGALPPGLPIGVVSAAMVAGESETPVELFEDLDRLYLVRLIDYGLDQEFDIREDPESPVTGAPVIAEEPGAGR